MYQGDARHSPKLKAWTNLSTLPLNLTYQWMQHNLMSPQLHPELWAHVVSWLKRPAPKAYERGTWKDFHQQDLVTVSLVSSTFHELAVPHLYSKTIIVNRLPHLLSHTAAAPTSLHAKITSKLDRLKLVRSLRLCGLGPAPPVDWTVVDLLERRDFAVVGESGAQREAWVQQGLAEARELATFFKEDPWEDLPRLRLDSLTIGQAGQTAWKAIAKHPVYPFLIDIGFVHTYMEYLLHLGVRHMCTYDAFGPYMLICGKLPGHVPRPTINVHHWDNHEYTPLVPGATIRHFFERGRNCDGQLFPMEVPGAKHLAGVEDVMWLASDLAPPGATAVISETKFEIYGLFAANEVGRDTLSLNDDDSDRSNACGLGSSNSDGDRDDAYDGAENGENDRGEGNYEGSDDDDQLTDVNDDDTEESDGFESGDEDFMVERMRDKWLGILPSAWKKTVKFCKWVETPCCEACGWDPKRHDFDWATALAGQVDCPCGCCTWHLCMTFGDTPAPSCSRNCRMLIQWTVTLRENVRR